MCFNTSTIYMRKQYWICIYTWDTNSMSGLLTEWCHLANCGLVTPYGNIDLDQHWFSLWLVAEWHQAITWGTVNTLRPRQNGRHFPDDIFKCIFLNQSIWISIAISLKFVPKGAINNISALVQIMAWRRSGDKPLSEPMMISLPTHICVTRP